MKPDISFFSTAQIILSFAVGIANSQTFAQYGTAVGHLQLAIPTMRSTCYVFDYEGRPACAANKLTRVSGIAPNLFMDDDYRTRHIQMLHIRTWDFTNDPICNMPYAASR